MPWLSIIVWLVSFLLAGGTKSGQAGKAALIATGAAAATWYAVDPANPNAAFDIFKSDAAAELATTTTASTVEGSEAIIKPVAGAASGWGSLDNAVSTTGKVLTSWGPAGTVGVVAGTAAATGSGLFKDIPTWVLYAGGALIAYKLLT